MIKDHILSRKIIRDYIIMAYSTNIITSTQHDDVHIDTNTLIHQSEE